MLTIAAGVGKNKNIVEAAKKADFKVKLVKSEEELIEMLLNPEIDAVVRGSLSASSLLQYLRENYGSDIFRASLIKSNATKFLLAPVGIDEGKNVAEKVLLIEKCCEFLIKIGKTPKIGVLSGGRAQDRGRSHQIDHSIQEGEEITAIIKNKYHVKHYYILIEKAFKDKCNLILAPDGISGNLIFRSLVLVGSSKSYGAITLGIDPIFVDTSRSQSIEGYLRALKFAHYLAKLKNQEI
jgi:putative methanogen marker protein 4